jgi:hypothetical protein
MKKIFIITVLLLANNVFSQKLNTKIKDIVGTNPNAVITALSGVVVSDFQVSELPSYAGKIENPKLKDGKLVASFPLKNVSITIPSGKIVYLKYCNVEFPYEMAISESQTKINLEGVCGVRSDESTAITVHFNGISTAIHDNDCKKVFGKITIQVTENAPTEADVLSNIRCNTGTSFRGDNQFTFQPMKIVKADSRKNISNYVFNDNPVPSLGGNIISSSTTGEDQAGFVVGKNALLEGRVKMIVTSTIAGAHKSCATCDGYSSNIHMERPVTEIIPLELNYPFHGLRTPQLGNAIVLGPFNAFGTPDGTSITAQGGFSQNFRVHLILNK